MSPDRFAQRRIPEIVLPEQFRLTIEGIISVVEEYGRTLPFFIKDMERLNPPLQFMSNNRIEHNVKGLETLAAFLRDASEPAATVLAHRKVTPPVYSGNDASISYSIKVRRAEDPRDLPTDPGHPQIQLGFMINCQDDRATMRGKIDTHGVPLTEGSKDLRQTPSGKIPSRSLSISTVGLWKTQGEEVLVFLPHAGIRFVFPDVKGQFVLSSALVYPTGRREPLSTKPIKEKDLGVRDMIEFSTALMCVANNNLWYLSGFRL